MRELWRRLRYGRTRERGLDDEIRFHIDQQTEKNVRAGMTPEEARRQAFVKFGGVEHLKERTRDEFRPASPRGLSARPALRRPRCSSGPRPSPSSPSSRSASASAPPPRSSASSTACCCGRFPTPIPIASSGCYQVNGNGRRTNTVSEPNFEDWKTGTRSFSAMAEMSGRRGARCRSAAKPTMTRGAGVSREFFDVMGVRPLVGRGFLPEEQRVGGAPAVIVSDRLWRTRLGRRAARHAHAAHRVDGASGHRRHAAGLRLPGRQRFLDRARDSTRRRRHGPRTTSASSRGCRAASRSARPSSEISALSRTLKQRYGDGTWMFDAAAVPLRESLTATSRPVLLLLFGAAILLLAIACLNVSNLHLARASTRQRELAVRLAIGADRGRLTRQLLAEALVLAVAASAVGVAIAFAGVRALAALQPANVPRIADVRVDAGVLGFALAVAVGTAVLLGAPHVAAHVADQAARVARRGTAHDGRRTRRARAAGTRRRAGRADDGAARRRGPARAELRAGAGGRSRLQHGQRAHPRSHVDVRARSAGAPAARRQRSSEVLAELGQLPGVERVGLINCVSARRRHLPQRPLHRDDAARRDHELRRLRQASATRQGPLRDRRLSHRERRLLCRDGHPAHPRPAVRGERRPRRAARRGDQRVARQDQVARPGSHRPLHAVRQHGRRPPRLPHRRHRRRRARAVAGNAAGADLLRLLPAAADVAGQHGRQGGDRRRRWPPRHARSCGASIRKCRCRFARSRTPSIARSPAGASACCSSASSARARSCWRRSASTG